MTLLGAVWRSSHPGPTLMVTVLTVVLGIAVGLPPIRLAVVARDPLLGVFRGGVRGVGALAAQGLAGGGAAARGLTAEGLAAGGGRGAVGRGLVALGRSGIDGGDVGIDVGVAHDATVRRATDTGPLSYPAR